jgi:hypothetical protein
MAVVSVGRLTRLGSALAALALATTAASAQTYGFATLPAGTLSHVISSAISKAMKERAGLNVLVQPAAGGNVIVPLVGRGEAEVGLVNIMEAQDGLDGGLKDLRLIGAAQGLRTPFFVRKDSGMFKVADLKGKRVTMGYSAMRQIDQVTRAVLASAGLTEADVRPVLVPNVVRSADDFMAGNSDMFFFTFGGPKVREADATVGGVRAVKVGDFLYGTTGQALECLDFATGEVKWQDRSIAPGSLCYADGKLYVHGENGDVALVEAACGAQPVAFTLAPRDSVEYKYRLDKGQALLYSWTATAPASRRCNSMSRTPRRSPPPPRLQRMWISWSTTRASSASSVANSLIRSGSRAGDRRWK